MTAKQIFNLILVICICVFIGSYISLLDKTSKQNDNIEQLRHNLTVKDTKISNMTFKVDELEDYLAAKDTKHKITVDSLLKKLSVKPKNLISYQMAENIQIIKDTILVDFKDTILKNDSLYHLPYNMVRDCNYISGEVISKDKNTKLFFTEIKNINQLFIVKSYKRNFFDKLLFRKGKLKIDVTSKCGETNYEIIEVTK